MSACTLQSRNLRTGKLWPEVSPVALPGSVSPTWGPHPPSQTGSCFSQERQLGGLLAAALPREHKPSSLLPATGPGLLPLFHPWGSTMPGSRSEAGSGLPSSSGAARGPEAAWAQASVSTAPRRALQSLAQEQGAERGLRIFPNLLGDNDPESLR